MRISRKNLKNLIETYLYEQEEDAEAADAEVEEEPEESEDTEETDAEEADAEVEEEPEEEFKPVKGIQIEIDGRVRTIDFILDKGSKELNYKVDGQTVPNKDMSSFVSLAALGLMQTKDKNKQDNLLKIIKLNKEFSSASIERAKQMIKQKLDTERLGFGIKDIKKALGD